MVKLNDVTLAARQPNMASASPDASSARTIAKTAAKKWMKAHPQQNHPQSSRRSGNLSPVPRTEIEIARRAAMERVSATREMRQLQSAQGKYFPTLRLQGAQQVGSESRKSQRAPTGQIKNTAPDPLRWHSHGLMLAVCAAVLLYLYLYLYP